jgi:hypothetical protein
MLRLISAADATALECQKQMVLHIGKYPSWDVGNPVADSASGAKLL